MGAVYRARDTRLGRDVALKVLLPEVPDNPEPLARFRREAQILASLNHPNIGHIYGLEESDGVVALVLELVERADPCGPHRKRSDPAFFLQDDAIMAQPFNPATLALAGQPQQVATPAGSFIDRGLSRRRETTSGP
jgi:hypothetical protein